MCSTVSVLMGMICKEWLIHNRSGGKEEPTSVWSQTQAYYVYSDWKSSALCTELQPPDKSWSSKFPSKCV